MALFELIPKQRKSCSTTEEENYEALSAELMTLMLATDLLERFKSLAKNKAINLPGKLYITLRSPY